MRKKLRRYRWFLFGGGCLTMLLLGIFLDSDLLVVLSQVAILAGLLGWAVYTVVKTCQRKTPVSVAQKNNGENNSPQT
ncbi:hypothetical protein A2482_01500 [Candidatus Falkowbacteria bacterium RIFOXYC2_FULL_48_21]|uniref:Uncharacterized protein n=1 Tax=Candidatus Falkowbacteria bacterium RIFOXYC2_FULL_48_21 TaxID=1798005 RepID=A0A1F5T711_9BACT|nr:MAG: hypothetical protein A2482_01500 [Candidatus Falkowbacteria bacterium RIFOXYC2_FULL_48_21]